MRILLFLAGLCLSLTAGVAHAQVAPSGATIATAEKSVVQVINRCANVTGSGFFWRDAHTVVSALHVTGNCRDLLIWLDNKSWAATVIKTIPERDLALLAVPTATGTPLLLSAAAPTTGERVAVLGYPIGLPSRTSATLEVIYGDNSTLATLLPQKARDRLSTSSRLSVMTNIVRLGGHLVPGYSGAPIINKSGAVVAVGSGGLQGGLVGIGWGIRASYVTELPNGQPPTGVSSAPNGVLYAMSREGEPGQTVRCGDAQFNFVEDRTISDVLETADDKAGFLNLASSSGIDLEVLGARDVSIFSDPVSGASFAVPKGTRFQERNGGCFASIGNNLLVRLMSSHVRNIADFQDRFLRFETDFARNDLLWTINPAWTYQTPMVMPDGLVVVRKSLNGLAGTAQRGWVTETILERDNLMMAIQLVNYRVDGDAWASCRFKPADDAACMEVRQSLFGYAEALLGTYLATFPVR